MNVRASLVWVVFPMGAVSCQAPRASDEPLAQATRGDGDPSDGSDEDDDAGPATPGCGSVDIGCTDQIDLLFVIDNSGTMAEEQENLARNFPRLVERLENLVDAKGNAINPDVQIMITTTDFGNPLCTPHQAEGYVPAAGAPITSVCLNRLERFTGLGSRRPRCPRLARTCARTSRPPRCGRPTSRSAEPSTTSPIPSPPSTSTATTSPTAQWPRPWPAWGPRASTAAVTRRRSRPCCTPSMRMRSGNEGGKPFLRPGALLAIAIITDEVDCSVMDSSVMSDEAFFEVEPTTGQALPSSGLCWNAGVDCEPNGDGTYACEAVDKGKLHPTSRYTEFLVEYLRGTLKKEVVMLGVLGVPPVTERNPEPPYEPLAGGVKDLVYRDWQPGTYPEGDLLPGEPNDADDLQFEFGIGPGCTVVDEATGFAGQGIPPVRIQEVRESLNEIEIGDVKVRCCIESICGDDFSAAIDCLANTISENIVVPTG